jgi:uncharacterized phage protein (TIGR01671 family)
MNTPTFKIWHKDCFLGNQYEYYLDNRDFITQKAYSDIYDEFWYEELLDNEYVVVKFTGCKDKNGTPIYEGDILVTDHDGGEGEANIGVVYFAAGTYMIDGDGPLYEHVFGHSPDILDNHTVIGNKFENSELLKA